jgi:hypothetical protein
VTVSTDGGREPAWSRDGKELFYRNGDKMMAVAVKFKPTFDHSTPELLFDRPYQHWGSLRNYDVASDGRFLMIKDSEPLADVARIDVVLNWSEELKQRVPTR